MSVALKQGDCLELMKEIPDGSVDLILTDPPYGIDYQSRRKKDKTKRLPKIINDKEPFVQFIAQLGRIMKPASAAMIFTRWDTQQRFIDELAKNGLKVRNVLIWDKQIHGMGDLKRSYGSRYESIIFVSNDAFRFPSKRPQDIITARRVLPTSLKHPNEKPVDLLEQLIQQVTHVNDTVLDCFIGSGSTGVACVKTGRNFIGYELDERYFDIAQQRISAAIKGESV